MEKKAKDLLPNEEIITLVLEKATGIIKAEIFMVKSVDIVEGRAYVLSSDDHMVLDPDQIVHTRDEVLEA